MSTVTGYEVRAGVVRERTLYSSRKEAAKHVTTKLGVRGFSVRNGGIVETNSVYRRGQWHHQELNGDGRTWKNYYPPFTTRELAVRSVMRDWQSSLKHAKKKVSELERQIKRGVK